MASGFCSRIFTHTSSMMVCQYAQAVWGRVICVLLRRSRGTPVASTEVHNPVAGSHRRPTPPCLQARVVREVQQSPPRRGGYGSAFGPVRLARLARRRWPDSLGRPHVGSGSHRRRVGLRVRAVCGAHQNSHWRGGYGSPFRPVRLARNPSTPPLSGGRKVLLPLCDGARPRLVRAEPRGLAESVHWIWVRE